MASKEAIMVREFIRKNSDFNKPLEEVRKNAKDMNQLIKQPEGIEVHSMYADGVHAELFVPIGAVENKLIIYFHGGGYCLDIENINRRFAAKVAEESGYETLLVHYRLAPENPYPAAHEDALTIYKWALKKENNSENIILMGDSSGCGLILATFFKLKELKLTMPRALIFISPVIDYTGKGESLKTRKELDPYQYDNPFSIAYNFLGHNDVKNPFISPLYGDLSGLPPILVHASDYDVFLSDSIRLSDKVKEVGGFVSMRIWEELWHVFHLNVNRVPEAQEALNEICKFIVQNIM